MSEYKRIPDWQWLTDILSQFDITEKYTLRKNAHDFTSLEARLYTEIQNRYTPRKKPRIIDNDGSRTSEEYEQAKRIHAGPIDTMERLGYGLMLDGDTFYKIGYELQPYDFRQNFNMTQAYEVHKLVEEKADTPVITTASSDLSQAEGSQNVTNNPS